MYKLNYNFDNTQKKQGLLWKIIWGREHVTDNRNNRKKLSTKKIKQAVIEVIDENQNGEIDIEDIIIKGLKTPGVHINRKNF